LTRGYALYVGRRKHGVISWDVKEDSWREELLEKTFTDINQEYTG
jgi:hypothetical protein